MTYDFQAGPEPFVDPITDFVYDSAEDVASILIEEPDYADFQFVGKLPPSSGWTGNRGRDGAVSLVVDGFKSFPGPERAEDGIRVVYPKNCEGSPAGARTTTTPPCAYRRGLSSAGTTTSTPCGDRVAPTYEAVAVGQTITVPAGTFENVFVLYNRQIGIGRSAG